MKLEVEQVEPKLHFALIKNLPGLLNKQLSNTKNKTYLCDRCLVWNLNKTKMFS